MLVDSLVISLSVVVTSWALAIIGIVLVVVGAGAGKILSMAGFGQSGPEQSSAGSPTR